MRVKKRWNQQAQPRSLEQMANAIGATIWKLAAGVLLNLENENFETSTQSQRIEVIEEIVCFLVHCSDRWAYPQAQQAQRTAFVAALARDLARLLEDSRVDAQCEGEFQAAFLDKLNRRSGDYSAYAYSLEEGASFAMRCRLGDRVQACMGTRDQRWIPDYIVGREAPEIEAALRSSLTGLVSFEG